VIDNQNPVFRMDCQSNPNPITSNYFGKDLEKQIPKFAATFCDTTMEFRTSVTRWFEQKRAQYLSKNAQIGAQSKNTKKGEKTTDLNKSEDS